MCVLDITTVYKSIYNIDGANVCHFLSRFGKPKAQETEWIRCGRDRQLRRESAFYITQFAQQYRRVSFEGLKRQSEIHWCRRDVSTSTASIGKWFINDRANWSRPVLSGSSLISAIQKWLLVVEVDKGVFLRTMVLENALERVVLKDHHALPRSLVLHLLGLVVGCMLSSNSDVVLVVQKVVTTYFVEGHFSRLL